MTPLVIYPLDVAFNTKLFGNLTCDPPSSLPSFLPSLVLLSAPMILEEVILLVLMGDGENAMQLQNAVWYKYHTAFKYFLYCDSHINIFNISVSYMKFQL